MFGIPAKKSRDCLDNGLLIDVPRFAFLHLSPHRKGGQIAHPTELGIRKELIARLTALNVVRTVILQAAQAGDIDPLRISFVDTLRTILSFSATLASAPPLKLPELYRAMLAEVASHVIAERPNRLEPRYLTRERKHYPALRRQTRAQWRAKHAA